MDISREKVMSEKIIILVDEDLEPLIEGYLEKRVEDRVTILQCIEKEDFASIQVLAHKMKGSGGGYGMDFISELGTEIEINAQAGEAEPIRDWMARLEDYLKRLEIHFVEEP